MLWKPCTLLETLDACEVGRGWSVTCRGFALDVTDFCADDDDALATDARILLAVPLGSGNTDNRKFSVTILKKK